MEEFKVYALDDDGNRIEPQQPEQEQVVEQEVDQTVEPQQNQQVNELPQEVEQDIVQEQAEEQVQEQASVQVEEEINQPVEEPERDDNWFLSKLKDRYEVELNSIDDLKNVLTNNEKPDLPEDVEKYLEFRKETGRSFSDFAELQKDWSSVSDEQVIREYYKQTKPHLDQEDIEHILGEQFSYDSELDDDKEVRAKKIAYKEALYDARNHFNSLKEKYKAPLESSSADVPEEYKEAYSFYNEYREKADKTSATQQKQIEYFNAKTDAFFNDEFKGFEFNIEGNKQVVKPKDVMSTRKMQGDLSNFTSLHLDEEGFIKDPASYHKALYAAMNADAIAKHFYEQGKADATGDIVKETKNIDMSVRDNKVTEVGGTKFRVLDSGNQFDFKIRKRN